MTAGDYLMLSVADTGMGITAENLANLFEPFFTTKSQGKGSGLGLASAYGTVTHYQGAITVDSDVDRGTEFTLYLPVVEGVALATPTVENDSQITRGSGKILLVDDDLDVLLMMEDCLKSAGYEVITCGDAIESLKFVLEHTDSLDLVLLDMMMPNLSEKELFAGMRNINPSLNVLIVSAYSRTGMVNEALEAGAVGFLEKPVSAGALTKAVAQAIQVNG